MQGILNVLKPPGLTSHDVVSYIRKITGQKKVGHTGTLDPGAAGVLPVCIGQTTRIIQYLLDDKSYRAEVAFGVSTTTQDAFGEILTSNNTSNLTMSAVKGHLDQFEGNISQIPPMTSAIKYRGKKLYELARAGIVIDRPPRQVKVSCIELLSFDATDNNMTRAMLDITCSKGTYVRTICHDLGVSLGCGAYMSFLLRTRVGNFLLEDTLTLEYIKELQEKNMLGDRLISMGQALNHLPQIVLTTDWATAAAHGNRLLCPFEVLKFKAKLGQIVCLLDNQKLLALAKIIDIDHELGHYLVQPVRVLVQT